MTTHSSAVRWESADPDRAGHGHPHLRSLGRVRRASPPPVRPRAPRWTPSASPAPTCSRSPAGASRGTARPVRPCRRWSPRPAGRCSRPTTSSFRTRRCAASPTWSPGAWTRPASSSPRWPRPSGAACSTSSTRSPTPSCCASVPRPAGKRAVVPPSWLDTAADWVLGEDGPSRSACASSASSSTWTARRRRPSSTSAASTRTWCDIVQGDLERPRPHRQPHLRAPPPPGARRRRARRRLQRVGGPVRPAGGHRPRAGRPVSPTRASTSRPRSRACALGLSPEGWRRQGGAPPNVVAGELVDELVPDAFPYQVLGAGHLARFDDRATSPTPRPSTTAAPRWPSASPDEWLPQSGGPVRAAGVGLGDPRPVPRARRRPGGLLAERSHAAPAEPEITVSGDALGDVPDLGRGGARRPPPPPARHAPVGARAGGVARPRAHTDEPAAVSLPLATFVRWWAAGLDDATRQRLKPYAAALGGTGSEPGRDRLRRWAAVDWLVRVQAPAWLRLAGMAEAAERVGGRRVAPRQPRARCGPSTSSGSAITIASRRVDITAAIVDEDGATPTRSRGRRGSA